MVYPVCVFYKCTGRPIRRIVFWFWIRYLAAQARIREKRTVKIDAFSVILEAGEMARVRIG